MTDSRRRVLLIGATGYIGRAVAETLTTRGYDVVAIVRESASAELVDCELLEATLTDADATSDALRDLRCDAVVSCIASRSGEPDDARAVDFEANMNVLKTIRDIGAQHFILLSAICVQKPRLAFQRAKLDFEAALKNAGVDYTIIRPTAFFKSLSGQIDRVRAGKPFLIFGNGELTRCKPISVKDLARFIADTLEMPDRRNRILPIGGPGPALTPKAQGEMMFEVAGQSPTFRSVPVAMFLVLAAILRIPALFSKRVATKRELLKIGHYYATESMLHWDSERQCYDAESTPEFGQETLEDHYRQMLRASTQKDERGAHILF
ncbi:MAG: NAD(P)H-binding protein [Pseudomonadota bacterium]